MSATWPARPPPPALAGGGAVVDERDLLGPPPLDVPVERVVAGVELGVGKPAVHRRRGVVQDPARRDGPVDRTGGIPPEALGIVQAPPELLPVASHAEPPCRGGCDRQPRRSVPPAVAGRRRPER